MLQKIINFLSSVGMVVLGIVLILVCSVSIRKIKISYPEFFLPFSLWSEQHNKKVEKREEKLPSTIPLAPVKKSQEEFPGMLSAEAVLVVDDTTDTVLWSQNSTEIRPLASITKLMTALVLRDLSIDWATTTVVVKADSDGTTNQVRIGERYTLSNLWEVGLVGSSNMAIRALVRSSGFSEEEFVARMNKKATELHLPTLTFAEPTGLSPRNVGSAEDIARLLSVALAQQDVVNALSKVTCAVAPLGKSVRRVESTNMILTDGVFNEFRREDVIGKTGHIGEAGYNFAVRLHRNPGQTIRVVILGADSNEARFVEARDLGEWIFKTYLWPEEEGYRALVAHNKNVN